MDDTRKNEVQGQESLFPENFLQLMENGDIKDSAEGLTVLLHAFLLETGFIPRNVDESEIYHRMPANWKHIGFCKIKYSHETVPETFCCVTFVPICPNLLINGTLENEQFANENVHVRFRMTEFVDMSKDSSNSCKIYSQVSELSRRFKDNFCFSLLSKLQGSVDLQPTFGLSGLVEEVKFYLLMRLPVGSIVKLSSVNKEFHKLTNSKYLWKFLYRRDFGNVDNGSASSSENNWKEMYKAEYKKKPRWFSDSFHLPMGSLYPTVPFPEFFPVAPDDDTNYEINMDPFIDEVFPQLRYRFRRDDWDFLQPPFHRFW